MLNIKITVNVSSTIFKKYISSSLDKSSSHYIAWNTTAGQTACCVYSLLLSKVWHQYFIYKSKQIIRYLISRRAAIAISGLQVTQIYYWHDIHEHVGMYVNVYFHKWKKQASLYSRWAPSHKPPEQIHTPNPILSLKTNCFPVCYSIWIQDNHSTQHLGRVF